MNEKIRIFYRVCALLILTFFFISGLWAVDIGASGFGIESGYVQGLFGIRSSNVQYHLGLMASTMSFLILSVLFMGEVIFRKEV